MVVSFQISMRLDCSKKSFKVDVSFKMAVSKTKSSKRVAFLFVSKLNQIKKGE